MNLSLLLAAFCLFQFGSHAVRSPARPMADPAPVDRSVYEDAVNKLHEIGVISDAPFWITNVAPGKFIAASPVQEIVMAAAGKFEPVDSLPQAIDVLQKNRVFQNAEKWRTDLQKPKIASGVVILLITSLARNIN
ncbi:MAG TPA: hypothetical protein PLS03_14485 [Terrimicrobiaceae bacterium]|nr:hypothetical protein [Terrimicrobiaceae bacterium]